MISHQLTRDIIYDFTPAYLKPPLQIRVPHLHKATSPNVTGDMVYYALQMIAMKIYYFINNTLKTLFQ